MKELRCTLLSDGVTDQALLPLLHWLLLEHGVTYAIQLKWADLRNLPDRRRPRTLSERIKISLELYPCDLLFVHRDAEKEDPERRIEEITAARQSLAERADFPVVCVVPVRMQEAWLLFDETAIRLAAGNKGGKMPLPLPRLQEIEQEPDPKETLYNLLRDASGLKGRRRRNVPVSIYARRVAEYIEDFTPLRALPAFRALETYIANMVQEQGWRGNL